jgi:hypothetical protein
MQQSRQPMYNYLQLGMHVCCTLIGTYDFRALTHGGHGLSLISRPCKTTSA